MEIANISERINVKSFMLKNGFTSFFKSVRVNSNNYPYVTFLRPNSEAENVYFSRTTSSEVDEGTDVLSLFRSGNIKVAEVTYSDGRPTRWKLVSANGDYVSLDDLGDF